MLFNRFFSRDKVFVREVYSITGFFPREIFLYRLALRHSSMVRTKELSARECNERLEFLGDTILDSIVSEYLFKIYPTESEGFLTEMRSKIVNRESLNEICRKLHLDNMIQYLQGRKGQVSKYMYGDALEAFIGAAYLDLGYGKTRRFVLKKIISELIDLKDRENTVYNYKSMLLEHVQKEKLPGGIQYDVVSEYGEGKSKHFKVQVKVGDTILGTGEGSKKKTAEQRASKRALLRLGLIQETEVV